MAQLHTLRSLTFGYDTREDRILGAVNAGSPDAWSCWLTRRLVLALLENAGQFMATTSPLAKRAAPEARKDVVAFEREAAVATTAPAMSFTPTAVLRTTVATADLAQHVSLTQKGDRIQMELRAGTGGANANLTRPEFQRILQMLQDEVVKAGWVSTPAVTVTNAPSDEPRGKLRH
ncbi:MAG: hypothetical protein WCG92_25105 [Hyphomicrobiales bacterium]|nr:hypothetical protein [Alphaproteobacteria bacterium]